MSIRAICDFARPTLARVVRRAGDSVSLVDLDGAEVGRGLARKPATEAVLLAGRRDLPEDAGVLVHRDELVVW